MLPAEFEMPEQLKIRLRKDWNRTLREVALGGATSPVTIRLRKAKLTADNYLKSMTSHRQWCKAWERPGSGVTVKWSELRLRKVSPLRIAEAVTFRDADALSRFIGDDAKKTIARLRLNLDHIGYVPGNAAPGLEKHAVQIASFDEAEARALGEFVRWRQQHPHDTLPVREIPITTVDTKWLEKHLVLVTDILADFVSQTGELLRVNVRTEDRRSAWVKVHKSSGAGPFGATEFAVRPAALRSRPDFVQRTLFVENQTTFHSLEPAPDTLIIYGAGKLAVSLAEGMPWLNDVECFYWGDMDTSGYLILDRFRASAPETISLFMDRKAFEDHRYVAAVDGGMELADTSRLTEDEEYVRDTLRASGRRIEQEKIRDYRGTLCELRLITDE